MTAPARARRTRATALLVSVAVLLLAMIVGLGYLIVTSLPGPKRPVTTMASPSSAAASLSTDHPAGASDTARQDALAAAPMLQLPPSAAQPQPLVTQTAGPPITVPAASNPVSPGGAPVPTGFPQTPQGALGQLIAIDEGAFSTTDMARVHEVYTWAAAPGAVPESEWSPAFGIRTLIDHLGGQDKARQASATFQAEEGQIKGSVGTDFVVACVLGQLDVSATTTARAGVGDCQRMIWTQGRWWIGPGRQAAYAPSAWPGSADAVRAGWRELRRAHP